MANQFTPIDAALHALADPVRRGMVERLSRVPASVSELAQPLAMSLPSVMQHLALLERGGLIRSQKTGRVRTCTLALESLTAVERWIDDRRREWSRDLDRLGDYLNETDPARASGNETGNRSHD